MIVSTIKENLRDGNLSLRGALFQFHDFLGIFSIARGPGQAYYILQRLAGFNAMICI
jgi:hypothetical protein